MQFSSWHLQSVLHLKYAQSSQEFPTDHSLQVNSMQQILAADLEKTAAWFM